MSDIQLFPQVARSRWGEDELGDAIQSSSPHVQFLLKELSEAERVAASNLKSKRVSYAIVQRICSSAGKDPLVLVDDENGEKMYRLNPTYRTQVSPLVADAPPPPPTPARPRRPRKRGAGRLRKGMSATDGIADPSGSGFGFRRVAQATNGRSLAFPEEVSLQFCQELMGFLNETSSGANRYRIVLDVSGPRLELA